MIKTASAFLLIALLLILAACGSSTATPIPTSTPIPTYSYTVPTEAPQVAAVGAATQTARVPQSAPALNPTAVARGQERYETLDCGSCHGENAEGGEAVALAGTTLSESHFIDFLRTGGGLGNAHLFSTDRLSDNGGRNLYAYLVSLGGGGGDEATEAAPESDATEEATEATEEAG
jgi:mono/diheme cytochrome c family protein